MFLIIDIHPAFNNGPSTVHRLPCAPEEWRTRHLKLRHKTLDPASSEHYVWTPLSAHNERHRSNTKGTETLHTRPKTQRPSDQWFAICHPHFAVDPNPSIDACTQLTRESASLAVVRTPGAGPSTAATTNATSQSTSRPRRPRGADPARLAAAQPQPRRHARRGPERMATAVVTIWNKTAPKSQRTLKSATIMRSLVCPLTPGCGCAADWLV